MLHCHSEGFYPGQHQSLCVEVVHVALVKGKLFQVRAHGVPQLVNEELARDVGCSFVSCPLIFEELVLVFCHVSLRSRAGELVYFGRHTWGGWSSRCRCVGSLNMECHILEDGGVIVDSWGRGKLTSRC